MPEGFLPVYSVDTEEEAKQLLIAACPRNNNGDFIAPELATEQTLNNLYAFGHRLANIHERMKRLNIIKIK